MFNTGDRHWHGSARARTNKRKRSWYIFFFLDNRTGLTERGIRMLGITFLKTGVQCSSMIAHLSHTLALSFQSAAILLH